MKSGRRILSGFVDTWFRSHEDQIRPPTCSEQLLVDPRRPLRRKRSNERFITGPSPPKLTKKRSTRPPNIVMYEQRDGSAHRQPHANEQLQHGDVATLVAQQLLTFYVDPIVTTTRRIRRRICFPRFGRKSSMNPGQVVRAQAASNRRYTA